MAKGLPDFWQERMIPKPVFSPYQFKLAISGAITLNPDEEANVLVGYPSPETKWEIYLIEVKVSSGDNFWIRFGVYWYDKIIQWGHGYGYAKVHFIQGLDYLPDNALILNLYNPSDTSQDFQINVNGLIYVIV